MFPIIDVRGNVIAFGGRIMTDEKPKYLNTSDTPVFKKSANLFSLNNAKKCNDRTLILCEGYMDVIAVNQAGFENAVATLGTALTSEQAVLMKRFADDVIICYDADEAGQKATNRAIEILRNAGLNIRVLTIPEGKDPDEFIRKYGENGGAAFYNLVKGSDNDVEYKLNKIRGKYNLKIADQKVHYLNEAIKALSELDSDIEQQIYASKLADETGVQKDIILSNMKSLRRKRYRGYEKKVEKKLRTDLTGRDDKINTQHREQPKATNAEEMLISLVINHPDIASYVYGRITEESFITDFNKKLYSYIMNRIAKGYEPLNSISEDFTQDEISKIYRIAHRTITTKVTPELVEEYIKIIYQEKNKVRKEDFSSLSPEEMREYIKKQRENRE